MIIAKTQNQDYFENDTNFQGLDHRKTVYDQSLLYVGSLDRDESKEHKIWK